MTTTDMPPTPAPAPPSPPGGRTLRRSRDGKVAAGVCAGLGEYFGVDPVLFRVLFATSAFFGGAGIIGYLLAWAAIPEHGTAKAPIDGWIEQLRRRNVPPWVVSVGIGVVIWAAAFSWWLPGPFFPVVGVVVLLVVVFGRRELQARPAPSAPVDLTKPGTPAADPATPGPAPAPAWMTETRRWWDEAAAARRERRRRALPVKITVLVGLGATLVVLGIVDAVSRIGIPVYFWTALGFVAGGLLVGAALRRTPWSIVALLPITVVGLVAFGGSHASFTDGAGERTWTPTERPASEYRLAFGQGTLDLRSLPSQTTPTTVRITSAAGQVRVLVPADANVQVEANVHIGRIDLRPGPSGDDSGQGGVGLSTVSPAPAAATGARVTVDVHLADGHVEVVRGQ